MQALARKPKEVLAEELVQVCVHFVCASCTACFLYVIICALCEVEGHREGKYASLAIQVYK